MRDVIVALVLVSGFVAADAIGSFSSYQYAKVATCIARNIDTGNLSAVRICF
jgi:hypothetical protein